MSDTPDKRPVVAVHFCKDDVEAAVVVSLLRGRGIEAFTNSQLSHDVFPVTSGKLGEVSIYVDEDAAENAIQIIDEAEISE